MESKGTITVAATPVPHAEILEAAKDLMAAEGWDLEIVEFTDYVQPNEVVESGDVDANYFQHVNYLNSYNEEKGTLRSQARSITSLLVCIPESRATSLQSQTALKSQFPTIQQTVQEHCCYWRQRV